MHHMHKPKGKRMRHWITCMQGVYWPMANTKNTKKWYKMVFWAGSGTKHAFARRWRELRQKVLLTLGIMLHALHDEIIQNTPTFFLSPQK